MQSPAARRPRRAYGTRWHDRITDRIRRRFVSAKVATEVNRRNRYRGPQAVETLAPPPLIEDHRPTSQAMPRVDARTGMSLGGVALMTGSLMVVAFLMHIIFLSQVYYIKQQQVLFDDFRYALANATAPVGQVTQEDALVPQGTPVAIVKIDKIGVNAVVVEGTSSSATLSGPGHRRDTSHPGQLGTSVIYGRQFTYGGTFTDLGKLAKGDKIVATTGQGEHTYVVDDIRYTGDPIPVTDDTKGHLTLVSAAGLALFPSSVVRVDAHLTSTPADTPAQMFTVESLSQSELPMYGDSGAWALLALEIVFLGVIMVLLWLSFRFWGNLQTWIVAVPLTLVLGIATSIQVTLLLPNLI